MNIKILSFQQRGDERGSLIVIEGNKDVPFEIKRIFYMLDTDTTITRGQHANRNSDFVLVNIQGHVKIKIMDGKTEEIFILDQKDQGIFIPKMIWKEMYDFSEDAILVVLSNQPYDENDYIRDYSVYLGEVL